MIDRQGVLERLSRLDWSRGLDREGLYRALLERNIALPFEFLGAIPPLETFESPDQVVQKVPENVWTIHAEREQRARGQLDLPQAAERTRNQQVS